MNFGKVLTVFETMVTLFLSVDADQIREVNGEAFILFSMTLPGLLFFHWDQITDNYEWLRNFFGFIGINLLFWVLVVYHFFEWILDLGLWLSIYAVIWWAQMATMLYLQFKEPWMNKFYLLITILSFGEFVLVLYWPV